MSGLKTIDCELAVIGSGMAGMAATLFAVKRGLEVVQIGRPVTFTFASGLIDLMAVHPLAEGKTWEDPWGAIEALTREMPEHPYAKMNQDDMQTALDELDSFLKTAGLPYRGKERLNVEVITAAGTAKKSFRIPRTMWAGVGAFENKQPCLLVGFEGLREFSPRQIEAVCGERWPDLRTVQIPFPGTPEGAEILTGEINATTIAQPENIEALAQAIRPHVQNAEAIGLPAILGLAGADRIVTALKNLIGTAIFEIPTGPPFVPGLRLLEAFARQLTLNGVRQILEHHVQSVIPQADGGFLLEFGGGMTGRIRSRGIILATGRFLGNGLRADRHGIRESLLDLPVFQPQERSGWHRMAFFDSQGHPLNQAGIEVDQRFRPLDSGGRPVFERLHAVGSILAHHDWMRMKCGAGLAVTTAFSAVKAFACSS